MLGYIENVKIISSFQKRSKLYGKIQSRASHGFLFRIKGDADYTIDGKILRVNEGELIFLPKGSCYEYVTSNGEENQYTSINFNANIQNPEIKVYPLKDFKNANYMLQGFSDIWTFGTESEKYQCLSDFYELLSYVSRLEHQWSEAHGIYNIIEPAIEYLKQHIYDNKLRVERLHHLCGISDTYFRRLFISKFAMTPQRYITKERLAYARLIIESGDYDSINSVSESVGYTDALYFSKAFRKQYGVPPSSLCE